MSKIVDVKAHEILDSRGYPTVETTVTTEKGYSGTYSVSSGNNISSKEAVELRDNDERYFGKGVLKATNNVNTIIKDNIIGLEISHQKEIDEKLIELDGTDNKSNLGANAILSVSIACLKAAAKESNKEIFEYLSPNHHKIPKAMFTLINGGVHSKNNIDIQDFMIIPKMETFMETLRSGAEIFHELKSLLDKEGYSTSTCDAGGFIPGLTDNKTVLNYIIKSIESAGYHPGKDVFLAIDVAATTLYDDTKKTYKMDSKFLSKEELLDYYLDLVKNYPIISIEDPYADTDIEGFKLISEKLSKGMNISGDKLFVTNKNELKKGIEEHICNSIVIKPNQVGTFYEMLETIVLARKNNYTCVMSHRIGETCDTFIIDAAVALEIPFIKCGSISRGEIISKYNRLLEIERKLNE